MEKDAGIRRSNGVGIRKGKFEVRVITRESIILGVNESYEKMKEDTTSKR